MFALLLSEWSFAICLTSYNRKQNVLNASLTKTFPSFVIHFLISTADFCFRLNILASLSRISF